MSNEEAPTGDGGGFLVGSLASAGGVAGSLAT